MTVYITTEIMPMGGITVSFDIFGIYFDVSHSFSYSRYAVMSLSNRILYTAKTREEALEWVDENGYNMETTDHA